MSPKLSAVQWTREEPCAAIVAVLTQNTREKPSVYTPAQPKPTWPGKSWEHHPTGYSTSPSGYYTPTPTSSGAGPTGTGTGSGACASVSQLVASFTAASPSATPTVPAQIAYECITSVPFNQSAAVALMDSIRPYNDWQTTIEYLRDPPAEYAAKIQPPYDFPSNFERIYNTAKSGGYANEYAFGFDLYEAVSHDPAPIILSVADRIAKPMESTESAVLRCP